MERAERTYYTDGKLKEETHYKGKLKHGATRKWHPNGALAAEFWYVNGRQTGGQRTWFDTEQIQTECNMRNDMQEGRATEYDPTGKVNMRFYMVDGHMLSRTAYDNACARRPNLPKYTDQEPPPDTAALRGSRHTFVIQPSSEENENVDASIVELLEGKVVAEALAWLQENGIGRIRFLGTMDIEPSIALVNKLYGLGATRVLAVAIVAFDVNQCVGQSSQHIVAYLPKNKAARKRLFDFESEHHEAEGLDGEKDRGQPILYLKIT